MYLIVCALFNALFHRQKYLVLCKDNTKYSKKQILSHFIKTKDLHSKRMKVLIIVQGAYPNYTNLFVAVSGKITFGLNVLASSASINA